MARTLLSLAMSEQLTPFLRAHERALSSALTRTVRATANTIRARVQRQISANLTPKLAKLLVQKNDPRSGNVLEPSARVYSVARYKGGKMRPGGEVDLIDLYQTAGTVLPSKGQWLAVPTKDAPVAPGGKRKATPSESGLELSFVRVNEFKAVLIHKARGAAGALVLYVLVRQTRRRGLIRIQSEVDRAAARVSGFYARQFAQEDAKLSAAFGRGLAQNGGE
jgi:hypothetical protein